MASLRTLSRAMGTAPRYWWAIAVVLVVSVGLAVAARRRPVERSPGLAAGAAFVDSVVARAAVAQQARDVSFGDAVVQAYLERQRLGLGSPFRLAEFALRDPRLDSTARRHVAAALLDRTLRGRAYYIDPRALMGLPADSRTDSSVALWRSRRHFALIERAVTESRDPHVGELAVRLAYAIAASEKTVDRNAVSLVAPIAALVRDRRHATADARRLIREARIAAVDPLELLPLWRRERRLSVERPTAEPLDERRELEAMASVPSLLDSVRAIARADTGGAGRPPSNGVASPILGGISARRLAAGVMQYAPPQAPIVTAVRHYGPALVASAPSPAAADGRQELTERALNEETLVAELARVAAREGSTSAAARLVVSAAVALRPYAQEVPWFPGDEAPSADDLRREFGITAVAFDDAVPQRWRPYYRRMLADGLRDLQRILPAFTLDGARIRFRGSALGGATLAMHDPGSRTIHLPIATSAGAIAHEVAHDLDWQMGRRRYGRRGSYGTDVVVREQRGRLAASLRGLTSARLIPPAGANAARPPDDVRPAEVFARTLDWFVSIALAREGRVNGYLSAVQDDVLSGHVAVLPRDVSGWSADALAGVLEEMTLVGAPLREWLVAQWGSGRARRPYTLAREIIAAPVMRRTESLSRESAISLPNALRCHADPYDTPSKARAALAALAAEARARGALRTRAERYPDGARPAWAESLLGQGPWSPDVGEAAVRNVANLILGRLVDSGELTSAFGWADAATRDELPWGSTSQPIFEAGCN
jgi:hypothetical protein